VGKMAVESSNSICYKLRMYYGSGK